MAGNSESSKKKSNKPAKSCPSAILKAVPTIYEKTTFSELNSEINYKDKAIIGKIHELKPIGVRPNGHIRKILLTDGLEPKIENEKKLTVFLLNQFAQDSEVAEVEGYIIIANFSLEKSTHHKEDEYPFQILVKEHESQVWFGKKVASSQTNHQSKKKKKNKQNSDVPDIPEPTILSNHYEYVALRDLEETEAKETYNVYGVVEKCDLKVTQGKRTQVLDLTLTDETEANFLCSIYCAKDETFPDVYPGDIIRIHRMKVEKFRSKLKGKCLSSKFILVFRKNEENIRPRTVAKSFTYTNEDASKVQELFEWYDKKNQPKLIREIQRGDFVNIICQVIGVYIAKNSNTVILKIWDGTKSNQIDSSHWGLRDEKLDEKLFGIAKNYYVVLSVYGQHCAQAGELKPGQYIEVSDAHLYSPKENPDECKLCLLAGNKEKRGIQVLNLDDNRLTQLKERLEKIVADAVEFANQTDDMLNGDNSIFLNCDISTLPTSQRLCTNEEDNANIQALNGVMTSRNNNEALDKNDIPVLNEEMALRNGKEALDKNDIQVLNEAMASRNDKKALDKNDIQALNATMPFTVEKDANETNGVVSITTAAIKPGQSTQEFGDEMQREYMEVDLTQENELSPVGPDPALNKTPVEYRMFLHNPTTQTNHNNVPPFNSDTPEEWWTSLPAISSTEGHSDMKPTSITDIFQQESPNKFRVLAAVLSYKPNTTSVHKLMLLYCPNCMFMSDITNPSIEPFLEQEGILYYYCPECPAEGNQKSKPILKYSFLISFELHDGTTQKSLETYLWDQNAVNFFKGITPELVLKDGEMANAILQMLWSICPNNRPVQSKDPRNNDYPILDFCIMSYTTSSTVYQIFDTKLI